MNTELIRLREVKKSCRTAYNVLNIFHILVTIVMILCFAGCALLFIFHTSVDQALLNSPGLSENLYVHITILGARLSMSHASSPALMCAAGALAAGLGMIFLKIALKTIRRIFENILNSESPFAETVTGTLKKSLILIIVFMGLSSGIVPAAVLALIFWCLYTIFQYGAELQRQADETL